jgi:hypothetical protein
MEIIQKLIHMKKYNLYKGWPVFLVLLGFSCQKPDGIADTGGPDGLLNFSVAIPGESSQYAANKTGPYNNGDTIFINVPTSEEAPLDVTKLKPNASLSNNSKLIPGLPGLVDFTTPLEITVVNQKGVTQKNFVKVLPTLPKTLFKKSWYKNAQVMGILRTNISGMTVVGNDLLIADFAGPIDATSGVKVFDKVTGAFKKLIPPPTTFTAQVTADDAGHFVVNRYNVYGAGFMVYYYEDVNSAPKLILNYANGDGCPVNLGDRMSVVGNLKQGVAYVYATPSNSTSIYSWKFVDGVPESNLPTISKYAGAGANWTYARVKRASVADLSSLYVSYCIYDGADTDLKKGSRFDILSSDMEITQMAKQNHDYKILDFDVFTVNGDKFLAILQQGFWAWDATSIKVFEITDEGKLKLVPTDGDYKNFMLFNSDIYGGTNYNRWGTIRADVKNNEVNIFATMATNDATTSGVMSYRMIYTPQ